MSANCAQIDCEVMELDPKIVRFSQRTINKSTTDVHIPEKYKNIDVVYFSDEDQTTSIDNRRLYRAQKSNIAQLAVNRHGCADELDNATQVRFQIYCVFHVVRDMRSFSYKARLQPRSWETAVAARCCVQSPKFLLRGEFKQPKKAKKRRSTHKFSPDNIQWDSIEDNLSDKFFTELQAADENVYSMLLDNMQPVIAHQDMRWFVSHHRDAFHVEELWHCEMATSAFVMNVDSS
jgi:hypothetical protein